MAEEKNNNDNNVGLAGIQKRMVAAFAFIILFFVILTFRIGWIQVVANEVYASKAAENQIKDERIKPERGSIFDRNMRELAVSTTSYRIWLRLVPYDVKSSETSPEQQKKNEEENERQINEAVTLLAITLEKTEEEIRTMLNTESKRVRIAKDVPKPKMEAIVTGMNESKIKLIEIEEDTSRKYPLGTLGSTIIGSVNNDGNGQSGIEREYNAYLSGIVGRKISSTDRKGNDITGGNLAVYESTDGVNVVLTVDETIQYYVEQAIARGKANTQAERVMAVVMDPKNGDILAMSDTDFFDPNSPSVPVGEEKQAEYDALQTNEEKAAFLNGMWRNPIVSDVYDPGSVFKLITVASAMEECSINNESYFFCSGSMTIYDREIKCHVHPDAHGSQALREAVVNSCNPAMIQIVQKMGDHRFYEYLELFGLTRKTGIDLPDETAPLIQSEDDAGPVGLATMSFGQGISITPIQMISAVSAIANEGKLMQPRVVKGIADDEGNMIEEFPSKIDRQIISKTTAQEVIEIMGGVANDRSLEVAQIEGYEIGVKTGTTQKLVNGEYDNHTIIGSMVAIAPIEDPQFVVLVIVDTPKIGKYGNVTAGPIQKEITTELLRYLNVKPNYSERELYELTKYKMKLPDVIGNSYLEAEAILAEYGLIANAQGAEGEEDFQVVAQYPIPGTNVDSGSTVFLYRE